MREVQRYAAASAYSYKIYQRLTIPSLSTQCGNCQSLIDVSRLFSGQSSGQNASASAKPQQQLQQQQLRQQQPVQPQPIRTPQQQQTSFPRPPAAAAPQMTSLPPGWLELRDSSGRPYYVDQSTGKSQWERPPPPPASSASMPPPPSYEASSASSYSSQHSSGTGIAGAHAVTASASSTSAGAASSGGLYGATAATTQSTNYGSYGKIETSQSHKSGDGQNMEIPAELERIRADMDEYTLCDALEQFNEVAAMREANTRSKAVVRRALMVVASLKDNPSMIVRENAARIIATISMNEETRSQLALEGAVSLLLALSKDEATTVSAQVARALSNLSSCERAADALRDQGGLRFMLNCVTSDNEGLAEWSASGLRICIEKTQHNAEWISRRGLSTFVALLESPFIGVREDILRSMRVLVKNEKTMDPSISKPSLVQGLLTSIRHGFDQTSPLRLSSRALEPAVDAIASVVRDEETAAVVVEQGEDVVRRVMADRDEELRNHGIHLLASMLEILPSERTKTLSPLILESGLSEDALSALDMELAPQNEVMIASRLKMLVPLVGIPSIQDTFIQRTGPEKLAKMINTNISGIRENAILLAAKFAKCNASIASEIGTKGALSFVHQALPFLIAARPAPNFDPEKEILLNVRLASSLVPVLYDEPCFVDGQFVNVLKAILHSPTDETVSCTTMILSELLCHDKTRSTVVNTGAVADLVALVQPSGGKKAIAAAKALAVVGKSERGAQELIQAQAVPRLLQSISGEPSQVLLAVECTRALGHMASQDAMLRGFVDNNGVEAIVGLLFTENIALQEAALDFFLHVAPERSVIQRLNVAGGLHALAGLAMTQGDMKIQAKALNTCCQLATNPDFRRSLVKNQLLTDGLVDCLKNVSADPEFVGAALRTFGFMCADATTAEALVTDEVAESIVEAAKVDVLRMHAVQCIVRIAEKSDRAWDGILAAGGLQLVGTLFASDDSRALRLSLTGMQTASTDAHQRDELAAFPGIHSKLISLAISEDVADQLVGCETLANMCQSATFVEAVMERGERFHLLKLLRMDSTAIVTNILRALRLLCAARDQELLHRISEDHIDTVIRCIDEGSSERVYEAALLLIELTKQRPNGAAHILSDVTILHRILQVYSDTGLSSRAALLQLIALLSSSKEFRSGEVIEEGITIIREALESGKPFLERPSLEIVANLADNADAMSSLQAAGIADVLVAKMETVDLTDPLTTGLAKAVAHVIDHECDGEGTVEKLVTSGAIDRAVNALVNGVAEAQVAAMLLLSAALKFHSARIVAKESSVLPAILDLATSDDTCKWNDDVVTASLLVVEALCLQPGSLTAVTVWGGLQKLVDLLPKIHRNGALLLLRTVASLPLKAFSQESGLDALPPLLLKRLCSQDVKEAAMSARAFNVVMSALSELPDASQVLQELLDVLLDVQNTAVGIRVFGAIERVLLFQNARGLQSKYSNLIIQKARQGKDGMFVKALTSLANTLSFLEE